MRIGLSGGTGFIGKNLVKALLSKGYKVRVLTRKPNSEMPNSSGLEFFQCDLLNADLKMLDDFFHGVDVFIHCAAEIKDQASMHALHVEAVQKLVLAASGKIKRWVQLSSVGVYGPQKCGLITETNPFNPIGEYEITKAKSEEIVHAAGKASFFEVVTLRPSNVFGAGMTNTSLFGLVNMVKRGGFFFIGSPGSVANYIHVDNVSEALILCAIHENAPGKVYNLSDSLPLEIFVQQIASLLKRAPPKLRLPEQLVRMSCRLGNRLIRLPLTESRIDALTTHATYSSSRIARELNYRHKVSIQEGLEELVLRSQSRCLN